MIPQWQIFVKDSAAESYFIKSNDAEVYVFAQSPTYSGQSVTHNSNTQQRWLIKSAGGGDYRYDQSGLVSYLNSYCILPLSVFMPNTDLVLQLVSNASGSSVTSFLLCLWFMHAYPPFCFS